METGLRYSAIKRIEPSDTAFDMPSWKHAAELIRWDLDAAPAQSIAEAKDAEERRERHGSDFLR